MGSTGLNLGVCDAQAAEAMELQQSPIGRVGVDVDRTDGFKAPEIGLHRVAMDAHSTGVVTARVAQFIGAAGLPLDIPVEQGNAHRRQTIDVQAPAEGPNQGAGDVGRPALGGGKRNLWRHGPEPPGDYPM